MSSASFAAAPTIAVAEMFAGDDRPGAAAVNELVPSVNPSVQLPTAAVPVESVACVAPTIDPPPAVTKNVTVTPATEFESRSMTRTAGGVGRVTPTPAV